jgi:hypothetical protein
VNEHEHEHGFKHLDLEVKGVRSKFHLGWKLMPVTDGPVGYPGEPYIPLAVSFSMTRDERRTHGHLDYALSRSFFQRQDPLIATEEDARSWLGSCSITCPPTSASWTLVENLKLSGRTERRSSFAPNP